jgi:hypothetical protein
MSSIETTACSPMQQSRRRDGTGRVSVVAVVGVERATGRLTSLGAVASFAGCRGTDATSWGAT